VEYLQHIFKRDHNEIEPTSREVGYLPLSVQYNPERVVPYQWTGTNDFYGHLVDNENGGWNTEYREQFEMLSQHVCIQLEWDKTQKPYKVKSALLRNLITGKLIQVIADLFIICCNSLNTPQLLSNSGICDEYAPALGCNLSEHGMIFSEIVLNEKLLDKTKTKAMNIGYTPNPLIDPIGIPPNDPIPNIWIPYGGIDSTQPFHCQIHRDSFPYSILTQTLGVDHRLIIELRWFVPLDQHKKK